MFYRLRGKNTVSLEDQTENQSSVQAKDQEHWSRRRILVTQYQISVKLQQTDEIKDLQPPVKEAVWPNG